MKAVVIVYICIVYRHYSPSSTDQLQLRLSDCSDNVAKWMRSNRSLLNTEKTAVLWCSSNRHQYLYNLLIRYASAPTTSSRRRTFATWVFTWSPTSACEPTSHGQRRDVSACSANCGQSNDLCQPTPSKNLWTLWCHWSSPDWTGNATLAGLPVNLLSHQSCRP